MAEVTLPLVVRDLSAEDLPACGWAGSGVPDGLERARRGEVDYLVVCPPSGLPIATGGINYDEAPGAGTLYQLHVHELLRSCGIGTLLIVTAEQRIRDRGLDRAELGVDVRDQRPVALYERLGYVAYGRKPVGWDQIGPSGETTRYETTAIMMSKSLAELDESDRPADLGRTPTSPGSDN